MAIEGVGASAGAARTGRARLLILAGSTEASQLAARLAGGPDIEVISSMAGRIKTPVAPAGQLRIGGFGGVRGLVEWLTAERIAAVVDATHPFTAHMPGHVEAACATTGVPRLRLRRPGWIPEPGDRWSIVTDMAAAARVVESLGVRRVLLTIGRQELAPFSGLEGVHFVVRSIEAPDPMTLADAEVVLDRAPFDRSGERELMASRHIEVLVTKNSGGTAAAPKLAAARELGIPVVMVARPPAPAGSVATTVQAAVDWCTATLAVGSYPAG